MILVFNKTDVKEPTEAIEWMRDFESFQAAVRQEEEEEREGSGYMGSLLNSMSLVLEEFYNHLSVVGVSAMTGDGVEDFFRAVEEKRVEFNKEYKPELDRKKEEAEAAKAGGTEKEMNRLMQDMEVSSRAKGTGKYKRAPKEEPETVSEAEEMDGESEDEARWVERDDDVPEEEMEEDADGSLQARYAQALKDESGGAAGSAAGYIRRTQG